MKASNERIVRLSKFKNVLLVLVALVFATGGIWIAQLSDAEIKKLRRFKNPLIVHGVGWSAIVFGALSGSVGIRKIFDSKPGLVFSSAGLTDNSSGFSAGFIPWTDIAGFSIYSAHGHRLIVVLLNHPEKYISVGSVLRRNINRVNHNMAGSPITITPNSLQIGFDDLISICHQYFSEYANSIQ